MCKAVTTRRSYHIVLDYARRAVELPSRLDDMVYPTSIHVAKLLVPSWTFDSSYLMIECVPGGMFGGLSSEDLRTAHNTN
jgi:hypothetical protein